MRDENFQADAAGGRDEIRDLATLLRAGADGELSSAERARLDEHLGANPGDAARVAFEDGLRAACGRAMGGARCPDGLRSKIERIAAESHPEYAAGVAARAEQTRSASFWNTPRFVRVAGAAAAIVLMFVVGGVLVTQSGKNPSGIQNGGSLDRELQYVAYRDQVARFVSNESERCWDSDAAADRKFVMKDRDTLVSEFRSLLKGDMRIPALDQPVESLTFRGGGRCKIPATPGAAHMQWDITGPDGERTAAVSMFVAPDNGKLPVREGVTYTLDAKACHEAGTSVLVWKQNESLIFLISESETGACEMFREQMGAPAENEGL